LPSMAICEHGEENLPNNGFHHDNPACHDSCGLINERKNHASLGLQVKPMFCRRASRARPTVLYARAILGAGLFVLRLEKKVFDIVIA